MSSSARILVVDDDPNGRFLTVHRIRRDLPALNILEVENAAAALEMIAGTSIDLLLTDNGIGPMDGISLIAELRRRAFARPIIMASMNPALESRALAAGATAFVYTGDGDEMVRLLKAHLPGPAAADASPSDPAPTD